nr:hypothetical protein [Tanacetum cinerariifolium]
MATTIEQQVALDEALIPSTKRLRIGRSNFRLPSDIQSKESTLQVVYDVLRGCPFFKAFLVTADVPKIYMQEFWATTYFHQYSIRFKMDSKKNIVDLEAFKEMLHISPRVSGQSFDELPFEEEILDFLRFLGHSAQIKTLTDVNVNKLFQPWRSFAAVINKCLTGKSSGFDSFKISQAQILRKRSDSDTSITPPTATPTLITTVAAAPRLTATAKGKKPAKSKSPSDPSEVVRTEAEQLNIVLRRSRQETNDDEGDQNDESDDGKEDDDDDDDQDDDERDDDDDDDDDEEEIAKIDEPEDTKSGGGDDEETENSKDDGNGKEDQGLRVSEEQRLIKEEEADELYRDVDINQGRGLQLSQDIEDSHMTLIPVHPDVAPLPTPIPTMTPSIITTITTASHLPIPPTPIPSEVLHNLPTFDSVFRFNKRLKSLEASFSEYRQTNPFAKAVSNIPVAADPSKMELKKILIENMEGNKSIQRSEEQRNLYKALVDAYEADKTILDSFGETAILKRRREDGGDQEGPSAGSDRGSKRRREGGEPESARAPLEPVSRSAGRSTTGSKSRQASASESAFAEEPVQTISQIEEPSHPVFETGAEDQPIIQTSQHPEWFPLPKKLSTPNRDWNKTLPAVQGSAQTWISEIAKQADSRFSFNELLDTPIDFSNFIMNRLRVDTLTPELLAVPTFKLMRGSCNSLTELEYHLEEVYKATTDQLDWVNPEGQQYPHNLLQPFLLIPDNRGRRVIPFTHFINNDLEYLQGGASSRKYTTSVTKTKAADYGHIKWIEDLGQKRQQFYEFTINQESALDVYSKRRIIAVIDLKIVEWHNYKHLDWILRREEDLQLGVESYQYRLNLTKPDMYRSDLKRREAYTAYSNPRGFIYQNKDKKNRLMRIDKIYKLSDRTLNDVHNALDDRQKGIRMQYLPQTIWRKGDKDRAAAMIQAIDKMLKTKRIMRSLERFVGGRLYEGDFWMLQRTI